MHLIKNPVHKRTAGFTLIQLAIGMALAALVFGAVWTAANQAWRNTEVYNGEKQLVQLVQTARNALMGLPQVSGGYAGAATTDLIQRLATMDVFPGDMRTSVATTVLNSPWRAAASATLSESPVGIAASDGTTIGNAGRFFAVRYQYLPNFACTQFVTRLTRVVDDIKLTRIIINSTSMALPVTVEAATTQCATGNDNSTVEFEFALRA